VPKQKKKPRKGHHQVSSEETISDLSPSGSEQEKSSHFGSEEVEEMMQNGVGTKHHSINSAHASKLTPPNLTQVETNRSKVNQSSHPNVCREK
jgi:hypothetical protein